MDGELLGKAVPQAPSLGRFDVLLPSFEVEKCGLCFLFVGEKYGEIDKKLIYVCVCVCVAQIKKKNTNICRVVRLLAGKGKWDVFFNRSPEPPSSLSTSPFTSSRF